MIEKTNITDQEWSDRSHGERFQCGRIGLTPSDNASGLGCAVFRVQAGKRAFPRHAHLANDEAIYVLSGNGRLEVGDQALELTDGDFALLPRGVEYAHVLINTGDGDLTYLCMSTMNMPDVVHYPDSDKLGVLADRFWRKDGGAPAVSGFYRRKPLDYWEGEDG